MKKIVAKNVNRKMFMNLVKQMIIVDKYVTLKIDNWCIDGLSYLPMHDVVKNVTVKNSEMFGEIEQLEKPIRISFTDGTKLLNMFKNYKDSDEIELVIRCDDSDDSEEMYAVQLETSTEVFKKQEKCADRKFSEAHITPLPPNVVNDLFSTENKDFVFDIDMEKMSLIRSQVDEDRNVKKFIYKVNNGRISITERPDLDVLEDYRYDVNIAAVPGIPDSEILCNKNIFSVMSLSDFTVYAMVTDGRLVYEHTDDSGCTVRLCAVIVTDPEEE